MSEEIGSKELVLKPIGFVRNSIEADKYHGWEEVVSEIVLVPHLTEALTGIEEFSHLEVIFWLDRAKPPTELLIHPQNRQDLPLVGFLATRTPHRSNPLGLTVVRLLERHGNILIVQGLDTYNGTPILDVKPFIPRSLGDVKVPEWIHQLHGSSPEGPARTREEG